MPRHQQLGELCDVDGHPVQKELREMELRAGDDEAGMELAGWRIYVGPAATGDDLFMGDDGGSRGVVVVVVVVSLTAEFWWLL